jgi:hypothetical protein
MKGGKKGHTKHCKSKLGVQKSKMSENSVIIMTKHCIINIAGRNRYSTPQQDLIIFF